MDSIISMIHFEKMPTEDFSKLKNRQTCLVFLQVLGFKSALSRRVMVTFKNLCDMCRRGDVVALDQGLRQATEQKLDVTQVFGTGWGLLHISAYLRDVECLRVLF